MEAEPGGCGRADEQDEHRNDGEHNRSAIEGPIQKSGAGRATDGRPTSDLPDTPRNKSVTAIRAATRRVALGLHIAIVALRRVLVKRL